MKCGDKGHKTILGAPCQQPINSKAKGCLWHSRTPEQRKLMSLRGNVIGRLKRALPADYQMIPFDSRESVIRFAEDMARQALTGDVDCRRVDTALRAAGVALSAFTAATQEKLVEAMLRVEHGGTAMLLLARLTDGLAEGRRRPLPGRALAIAEGEAQ